MVIGQRGRPFQLPVEHGKVREFVRAVEENAIDPDAEHAVIPPTFLATAMWWEHPDSNPLLAADLDPARMLHVEQEYVFHGPPPEVGTVLTGQMYIAKTWDKQGKRGGDMTFVSVTTEYRDESGALVAESIWTEASISRAATESGASA
ncbi:MAG: MaoC family dehydratase N-terminal domain-containing protein [Actinobacteria bacterium]|nr:MaoC family dehydratase N-terminal domain-containing protein [Actinomycetota bacterium]